MQRQRTLPGQIALHGKSDLMKKPNINHTKEEKILKLYRERLREKKSTPIKHQKSLTSVQRTKMSYAKRGKLF